MIAPPPIVEKPLVVAPLPAEVPERLPHTFEPTRYAARLHVDPNQATFSGTIEITGEIAEPSALIWLSAEDLVISRVTATRDGATVRMKSSYERRDKLALQSEQPLAAGTWTLSITYGGSWSALGAVGGFREKVDGAHYAFTQFEPDYAARVFPCFDEPDRKVPWQLTLDVPDGMVAVSNAPIESETRTGGPYSTKTVRFAPTPPLPSYLIAFAVGPFDVVDAGASRRGVPIRILTTRGRAPAAAHAAIETPHLLDRIETWIGVPFPYPKLDFVEVPETADWWAAMENAGLITFRSQLLGSRREWDSTAAHELAHQWFGDLVTPAWWNDIWLNESFAAWIADKFADPYPTGWSAPATPFVLDKLVNPRRHLGSNDIWSNDTRRAIAKGHYVLHVLDDLLGERMPVVLQRYLTANAHGVVRTADLRSALADVAGEPLATAFDRYASRPTADLAFQLRCSGTSKRVEVTGFDTTALVCIAYDHDGTRRDRCAHVGWGAATIELDTKTCPRWILPRAAHELTWDIAQLEAVRDFGWPALNHRERIELLDHVLTRAGVAEEPKRAPRKAALRLSFVDKASTGDDLVLLSWTTAYLLAIEPSVPAALRPRFDSWISQRFGAQARSRFGARGTSVEDDELSQNLLFLAVGVRDPGLVKDATALLPQLDKLAFQTRILVLRAAIADNPKLSEDLTAELPKAKPERANLIGFALDATPNLPELITNHVTELRSLAEPHRRRLLARVCDLARQGDVERLGKQLLDKWNRMDMQDFQSCVRTRALIEPELEAFLDSALPAPKPSQKTK